MDREKHSSEGPLGVPAVGGWGDMAEKEGPVRHGESQRRVGSQKLKEGSIWGEGSLSV